MGENQRRTLHAGNHVGHGERLAGSGRAEQDLIAFAFPEPPDQCFNRLRLIAGGRKLRLKLEFGHGKLS